MPPALQQKIELVTLDSLTPHPRNPRQGDIGAVMTSIAANGWFGAVLVQRLDGRPDTIVGGEHRWKALRALSVDGFTGPDGQHRTYAQIAAEVPLPPLGKVPIIARPWTDEQALRVLLADNRTADLATYDEPELLRLITEFGESEGGLLGTGFDGDDLDAMLAADQAFSPRLDPTIGSREVSAAEVAAEQARQQQQFADIDREQARRAAGVTCPNCGHDFEVRGLPPAAAVPSTDG